MYYIILEKKQIPCFILQSPTRIDTSWGSKGQTSENQVFFVILEKLKRPIKFQTITFCYF